MPVVATPTTPQVLTMDDIRGFMRDVAGQVPNTGAINILYMDFPEFSDTDIQRAIKFCVSRYNVMTPITSATQDGINPWLLLIGATEILLWGEGIRQVRNQVSYSDGNVAAALNDKMQLYVTMAQYCRAEFEEKAKAFKVSQNMESCYGSLGSGYRSVSRFMHTT